MASPVILTEQGQRLLMNPLQELVMDPRKFPIAVALTFATTIAMAATAEEPVPRVTIGSYIFSQSIGENYMGYTGFVSTKTRAQVKTELRDARRRGQIYDGEAYPGPLNAVSTKSRMQVLTELKDYRAKHPQDIFDGAFRP